MKNLFLIFIFASLSLCVSGSAKADGAWGEMGEGQENLVPQQEQDQLISAELNDEVQQAIDLNASEKQAAANKAQKSKVHAPAEKPVTEESAIADLGKELDAADAEVHKSEVASKQATKLELKKVAKAQKQLRAQKNHQKAKTVSSKNKAPKFVYGGPKVSPIL